MGTDLIVKQDMFPINRDMYVYIYTYISVFPCRFIKKIHDDGYTFSMCFQN